MDYLDYFFSTLDYSNSYEMRTDIPSLSKSFRRYENVLLAGVVLVTLCILTCALY